MVPSVLSRAALVVVSAVAMLSAVPAFAQTPQEGTKVPVPHNQVISANPFGLVLRWWNVEFERKITPSSTWGVSGSALGVDDVDFASVNGLWRYYPQGAALTGVFLGARAGVYHGSDIDESHTAFGVGFEVGYTWLLGARRNVGLSLGVGLTRLVGSDGEDWPAALPTIRLLNVGIAF
jgi:Protein of unknown function (DUF3575)